MKLMSSILIGFQFVTVAAMALSRPTNLQAKAISSSQIQLTFTDNSSDEDSVYVIRSLSPDSNYAIVGTVKRNITSFTDSNLKSNTLYYYRVAASKINSSGQRVYSYLSSRASARTLSSSSTPNPTPSPSPSPTPSPTPTSTPPPTTSTSCGSMNQTECEVMRLVNVERSKAGLNSLKSLSLCNDAAQFHATDMATRDYFSHDGLDETWNERMQRFGLTRSAVGENIAFGQRTPADVMNAWMNSSGHRANILGSQYRSMGVGMATNSRGTIYWVQCFSGMLGD